MFKFLRSNAKSFYWIIAATFIAFIFLAWGMDMSGQQSGPSRGGNAIGSVNGVDIPSTSYERAVQNIQSEYRQKNPDRQLTANQLAEARDQAWNQLVRDALLNAEINRLGLTVSDEEIVRIFKESPPPEILAAFRTESGEIDMDAYYAALGNRSSGINWIQVENWVRESLPRQKLLHILAAGVAVSSDEIREAYEQQTGRAIVEYMGLALKDQDTEYEPTDAEIQAYYESHTGDYHRAPAGLAKVAAWEITPTTTDIDEVRDLAIEVKSEIESGARTFEDAAAVYGEDGSAANGGDLGVIDRNRMVASFTDAAFALPVGQISDPVQTQFGFHLIEILDQEMEDGEVARVHARHILMKVTPSETTRDAVHERAGAFRDQADAANFLALAGEDSTCMVLTPAPFSEGRDIPGLRLSAAGSHFVFRAEVGEISPLFYNDDQVYVVLAEGLEPEGPQALEKVRSQVVLALKHARQEDTASQLLSPAVGRVQLGESMTDVAAELGMLHAVTDTIGITSNVPDVGYASPLNMVALKSEVGTLIPEVVTDRGVFAMSVIWRAPVDEAEFAARRDAIRAALMQRKQGQALESWFQSQLDAANIKDFRDELTGNSA